MKKNGLVNRSVARMLRRLPRWWRASGSTSTIPEHEEAWLVKHASALLADSEGAVLAGNCVICDSKRAWKPADETDAEPKPALLCWKFAFSLELLLKARGRGSGTWDLTSRENRTHDLQRVWDSLLDVDKEKARRGLSQYSSTLQFDLEIKRVRNAYREFQYLTDSPHRNCKTALKSLVLLNCGFMKGCYDEPRFANVDTGLLNIKTLALDDFSATERIVLEEAQKKGFVLLVRAPGSTTIITDTDMPEQRRRTLQPRTPEKVGTSWRLLLRWRGYACWNSAARLSTIRVSIIRFRLPSGNSRRRDSKHAVKHQTSCLRMNIRPRLAGVMNEQRTSEEPTQRRLVLAFDVADSARCRTPTAPVRSSQRVRSGPCPARPAEGIAVNLAPYAGSA